MLRLWLSILAGSFVLLPATAHGDDAKELKTIATAKEVTRGYAIGPIVLDKKSQTVIRSAEELVDMSNKAKSAKDPEVQKEMTSALAKLLKVEDIDWSKQMIVVGVVESIDSMKADGKVLTVNYTPYIQRPIRAVPAPPKVMVLTERVEGEVKFVPSEKKEVPKK
jgi:hypothetical protein